MAKSAKKVKAQSSNLETQKKASDDVYIIGIGASAGGLQALSDLFSSIPNDGVAYVIIQHLSSEHRSYIKELLSPHSMLEIIEAEANMPVQSNKVYIIPNDKELTIKHNQLNLSEKLHPDRSKTIDVFFKSLAADKGQKAIGIILSGTGTDGTDGIIEIKKTGGMVIVQDPATARFDGMPRNAISTGYADHILEPDKMPQAIFDYVKVNPILKEVTELVNNDSEADFYLILDMVHEKTGIDFTNYKRPTIVRRISRRMAVCNVTTLVDYRDYLNLHNEEVITLGKEFLIGVTKFFRDKEAYEALEQEIIPVLVNAKNRSEQLRVWVTGCSTGEEAYSLAILLRECMDKSKKELEVKIFGSDIDRDALDIAGKGLYLQSSLKGVSEQRLQDHFVKENGHYRINQRIRRMVVFAPHNVANDPPFSKIDLVSCRNMLIYLNPLLQKKVIDKFHYALKVDGYLFLGSSESIGDQKNFVEVNKKWKIFRNISPAYSLGMESFTSKGSHTRQDTLGYKAFTRDISVKQHMHQNYAELLNETIMGEYGYAAVFVDEHFDIMHGIGRLKNYLDLPEQNFTFNLLKLVPLGLGTTLGTMLRKALRDKEKVSAHNLQVRSNKGVRYLNVIVNPSFSEKKLTQNILLVLFSESVQPVELKQIQETALQEVQQNERVQELEVELEHTKDDLQAVVEELETSNEELQSTNEELLSSNEELQSTNEELQSLNEELHTINTEHQFKIRALVELDDDLNNYFRSTDIGQIFLDERLIIRKFTPAAAKLINLIDSDIGRSFYHISNNLRYEHLIDDIREVIIKNISIERELQDKNSIWYQMRVIPYVTQERSVDGAIVIFINIHELKNLHLMQAGILNSSTNAIVALRAIRDEDKAIVDFKPNVANQKALELLNLKESEIINITLWKDWPEFLGNGLFERLVQVVKTGDLLDEEQEILHHQEPLWLHIVAVKFDDGLVLTLHSITDRKIYEQELQNQKEEIRLNAERFRLLLEAVPHITWTNRTDGAIETFNEAWYTFTGLSPEESLEWGFLKAIHPDDLDTAVSHYKEDIVAGTVHSAQVRIFRKEVNSYHWHLFKAVPIRDEQGNITLWIGTATDIQFFKDAEEANIELRLTQHRELLKAILETQEAERKNISEALHNGLGQILYASKLNLHEFKPKNKKDQGTIDKIDTLLKESIQITRNISYELTPSILKDFGFKAALEEMVSRVNSTGLKVTIEINGFEKRVDGFVELSLYRIVQELLNNIIKHAKATKASVFVDCEDNQVTLIINDNGIGLNNTNIKTMKGLGLRSIHHRLELLDGKLDIDTCKEKGTTFTLTCMLQ